MSKIKSNARDGVEVDDPADIRDVIMRNAELKGALVLAGLIRELAHVEEARKKRFAAIVRFVRHCEAKGPARDMLVQIDRDEKLCGLLVDYEEKSEIIGMVEFVRAFKMKQSRRGSNRNSASHSTAPELVGSKR